MDDAIKPVAGVDNRFPHIDYPVAPNHFIEIRAGQPLSVPISRNPKEIKKGILASIW